LTNEADTENRGMNVIAGVEIFGKCQTLVVHGFCINVDKGNVVAFGVADVIFDVGPSFVGPLISS